MLYLRICTHQPRKGYGMSAQDLEGTATRVPPQDGEPGQQLERMPGPPAGAVVPAARATSELATHDGMTIDEIVERRELVKAAMDRAMVEGQHYGKVPGVSKPALLKPGAELLNVLFKLAPVFPDERLQQRWHEDGHLDVKATCVLYHYPTGLLVAEGVGMCSTQETKYAYRNARRTCPQCGAESLRKSKYPPRGRPKTDPGGWWCPRDVGCGAEFAHDDKRIEDQVVGKVKNPDLADQYNTVVKMACKRAMVDAALHATGASDVFTQDVEEGKAPPPDDTPFEGAAGDEVVDRPTDEQPGGAPAQEVPWEPEPGYQPRYQSVKEALAALAKIGDYPWAQLMGAAVQLGLGVEVATFGDLPTERKREVWLRLNRVADWLIEHCGDFPPPSREDVTEAYAYGFEGVVVPVAPDVGWSRDDRLRKIAGGGTTRAEEAASPAPAAEPPVSVAAEAAAGLAAEAAEVGAMAEAMDAAGGPAQVTEAALEEAAAQAAAAPAEERVAHPAVAAASPAPSQEDYELAKAYVANPEQYGAVNPATLAQAQEIVRRYEAGAGGATQQ